MGDVEIDAVAGGAGEQTARALAPGHPSLPEMSPDVISYLLLLAGVRSAGFPNFF